MKNGTQQPIFYDYGKLPPQAVEIEEAILGAIMSEKSAIEKVDLVPIDFYKNSHQLIFSACKNLHEKNNPIDMLTVCEELRKIGEIDNVGGAYSITVLSMKVNSANSIEYHSMIVKQKSIARRLIEMSSLTQQMAFDDKVDVSDIIEFVEKSFTDISTGSIEMDATNIYQSIEETMDYMQKLQLDRQSGKQTAITTGLKELDKELNGGWKAPDLIVLGGRPSMGKTQFAVHFSKYAALDDGSVLFISIEMTKIQLILRMLTENSGIDFYKIKTGQLNNEEWMLVDLMIKDILKLNLHIADNYNIRYLQNIKSMARKMARKNNLKFIIIDYLQLIKTNQKFGTRDLEVGYITGELKNLCKELNVPIILLAQLNRPVKGQKVGSPKLEDLRESGNIEQDADIVIFPHRPTYYDSEACDEDGISWKNRGGLIIAKNREGQRDIKIKFQHDESFKKIWNDGDPNPETIERPIIQPNVNFYEPIKENKILPF